MLFLAAWPKNISQSCYGTFQYSGPILTQIVGSFPPLQEYTTFIRVLGCYPVDKTDISCSS